MRPNLIIRGLEEVVEENCVDVVKQFIKNKLEIESEVPIRTAYRLGKAKGKTRLMMTVLTNSVDKGKIFANVKKLQDKQNSMQKNYQSNEDLPAEAAEQK